MQRSALKDRECFHKSSHTTYGSETQSTSYSYPKVNAFQNCAAIWEDSYLSGEPASEQGTHHLCTNSTRHNPPSAAISVLQDTRARQPERQLNSDCCICITWARLSLSSFQSRVTKWVPIKPSILLLCWVGVFSTCSRVIVPSSVSSTNRWWLPSSNTITTTIPCLTVWLVGFLPSPTT